MASCTYETSGGLSRTMRRSTRELLELELSRTFRGRRDRVAFAARYRGKLSDVGILLDSMVILWEETVKTGESIQGLRDYLYGGAEGKPSVTDGSGVVWS